MNSWGAGTGRNAFHFATDPEQRGADGMVWAFLVFRLKGCKSVYEATEW